MIMPPAPIVGLIILFMTAGCAGIGGAPQREPAAAGAAQDAAVAAKPPEATAKQEEGTAVTPPKAQAAPGEAVAVEPAAPLAAPPIADSPGKSRNGSSAPTAKIDVPATKADAPAAKTPAQARATPAPTVPTPKMESRAPGPEKPPAPPPLDLTSLEKRLKETDAIGVFTKLTLKNQIDDLLDRFRAHYEGKTKTSLSELRQPFDLLILKVLSLLQDRESSLAKAILASREAIWGILSDPDKFKNL
jgi:hypothetical protein